MYILVVNNVHSRAKYVKLNILLHRGNVFFTYYTWGSFILHFILHHICDYRMMIYDYIIMICLESDRQLYKYIYVYILLYIYYMLCVCVLNLRDGSWAGCWSAHVHAHVSEPQSRTVSRNQQTNLADEARICPTCDLFTGRDNKDHHACIYVESMCFYIHIYLYIYIQCILGVSDKSGP